MPDLRQQTAGLASRHAIMFWEKAIVVTARLPRLTEREREREREIQPGALSRPHRRPKWTRRSM